MKVENPPAFPNKLGFGTDAGGMTLRDWFAGQALAGLLTAHHTAISYPVTERFTESAAMSAFAFADAMLAERAAHKDTDHAN